MAGKKFRLAAVGGTFDLIHKGHEELLRTAFELADHVVIGLVTDALASTLGKEHETNPYIIRLKALEHFLSKKSWIRRAKILPLIDPYGPTVSAASIDCIVVSPESRSRAEEINELRRKRNLKTLAIRTIDWTLSHNGKPISTTRIRRREIDAYGSPVGT